MAVTMGMPMRVAMTVRVAMSMAGVMVVGVACHATIMP